MEIENITDQIVGFSQEVAIAIKEIEKMGFTRKEAIKIVNIGVHDIMSEVQHHRNKAISMLSESLCNLAESIREAMEV